MLRALRIAAGAALLTTGSAHALTVSEIQGIERQSDTCKQVADRLQRLSAGMREEFSRVESLMDNWRRKADQFQRVPDPERKRFESHMDNVLRTTQDVERTASELLRCAKELESRSDVVAR